MSSIISIAQHTNVEATREKNHRVLVYAAATAAVLLILFLTVYGFDYYKLSSIDRPFSPKHSLLKPSGRIGIKLGISGVGLFGVIFFYAVRKRIPALARRGSMRHWLNFHVVAGCTAPVVIAFHSAFKFRGVAGAAFWLMFAVALSGIIGRYLYAQIPRSLNSAELSLQELEAQEEELRNRLEHQRILPASDLTLLLRAGELTSIHRMSAIRSVAVMLALDVVQPFQIARLRRRVLPWHALFFSFGGLLTTSDRDLEEVIATARRRLSLSKRVMYLNHTRRLFHLWHVVHRPFSYSFVLFVALHIVTVIALGYK